MSTSSSANIRHTSSIPKTKLQRAKEYVFLKSIVRKLNNNFPSRSGEKKFIGIYYSSGDFWEITCTDQKIWYNEKFDAQRRVFKKLGMVKIIFSLAWGGAVDIELKRIKLNGAGKGHLITATKNDKIYYEWRLN